MVLATTTARTAGPETVAAASLELRSVTKRFGGVTAVDDISLEVAPGEALAVIGPNGAGKSTLLNVIAGGYRPDTGAVYLDGHRVDGLAPHLLARTGIALVHQVPRPFPRLSVRDNVLVGVVARRRAGSPHATVDGAILACGLRDRCEVPADRLGVLDLKRLELARALATVPRVLLLDEPAAGLVGRELDQMIELIRSVHRSGRTVLLVEHVERVVSAIVDRVVVLDWGRRVAEGTPAQIAANPRIREIYLGHGDVPARRPREESPDRPGAAPGRMLLRLDEVSSGYGSALTLRGVTMEIAAGEVVAVLGANGAGKSTLASTVSGVLPVRQGRIGFAGTDVTRLPGHHRARLGIAHCPEGRRVFAELTVRENLSIAVPLRLRRSAVAARMEAVHAAFPALAKLGRQRAGTLSGGQQQILAIGRALMAEPALLVCDEISLGLAPVAVDALYEALARISLRGVAVLLIEQHVHRGLSLADRAYVLERGQVSYAGDPEPLLDPGVLDRAYFG